MSSVGRNDPCPCGSGRKFKKCCLNTAGDRTIPYTSSGAGQDISVPRSTPATGLGLHPYAIAKLVENPQPELMARFLPHQRAALADKWTRAKVAHLETDEIVRRLLTLGIDATPSAFVALAEGRTSACDLAEVWTKGLDYKLGLQDDDFALLAACELWKRYIPDRPSVEMVDDWVTEGYDYLGAREEGKAISIWLRVWDHVHASLDPQVKTFVAADPSFNISQFFGNWIQDFELELGNAALDDPNVAAIGIRVIHEVMARFVDEDKNTMCNLRCSLGRLLFRAGRAAEGEVVLSTVIQEFPQYSHGYVTLSDELAASRNGQPDIQQAITLLEQALAYPVVDADGWDIEARLADLKAS